MPGASAQFPPPAAEWLTGSRRARVLTLSSGVAVPKLLSSLGHEVLAFTHLPELASRLHAVPQLSTAIARAESLPLAPSSVDVILCQQTLPLFAPGLALPEFARVLTATGHVASAFLKRDESVPWVRRLVELMRSVHPDAMRGDVGETAEANLLASKYFPHHESKEFRVWVPVSADQLSAMVSAQPFVRSLEPDQRTDLLARAADLYQSAGAGQSLRLPYQLVCHKAFVDHAELTTPIQLTDDALVIPL